VSNCDTACIVSVPAIDSQSLQGEEVKRWFWRDLGSVLQEHVKKSGPYPSNLFSVVVFVSATQGMAFESACTSRM
jgi:hypothetical protein